jgi:hypothetical protein
MSTYNPKEQEFVQEWKCLPQTFKYFSKAEDRAKEIFKDIREAEAYHGNIRVTQRWLANDVTEFQNKGNYLFLIKRNYEYTLTAIDPTGIKEQPPEFKKRIVKIGDCDVTIFCKIRTEGARIVKALDGSFWLISPTHRLYTKKPGLPVSKFRKLSHKEASDRLRLRRWATR